MVSLIGRTKIIIFRFQPNSSLHFFKREGGKKKEDWKKICILNKRMILKKKRNDKQGTRRRKNEWMQSKDQKTRLWKKSFYLWLLLRTVLRSKRSFLFSSFFFHLANSSGSWGRHNSFGDVLTKRATINLSWWSHFISTLLSIRYAFNVWWVYEIQQ